jgi:uncharacterized protein YkwD
MMISRLLKFPLYIFTAFLIFSFTNGFIPHGGDTSIDEDILYYVNLDRKSKGLKPLQLNKVESSLAEQHSRDMASGKVPFGHDGLNDRARAIQKQLGSVTAVGENVASGPMTAKEAVDGWLHSPGHKRNIEGDFTLTGIGWAKGQNGVIYFTQIFSR